MVFLVNIAIAILFQLFVTGDTMITAKKVKKFFKDRYGIDVLATGWSTKVQSKNGFACVRIKASITVHGSFDKVTYPTSFPEGLGNLCLRIVYPNQPYLHTQNWAGNIGPTCIAMKWSQWESMFEHFEKTDGIFLNNLDFLQGYGLES